jgi:hypothetical protein
MPLLSRGGQRECSPLSCANSKMASPHLIAPVITADIRTASGDLGPDWSQKSRNRRAAKVADCLRGWLGYRSCSVRILGPRGWGWPAWPQPGGACGPPCRGRGPGRRWPSQRRVGHTIRRRQQGRGVAVWRRLAGGGLGSVEVDSHPGPACPPSRWLAPGRGGQSGPSAGLRPAPRRRSIAAIESATRCRRRGRSYVFPRQAAKPVDRHWIAISKLLVAPSMTAIPNRCSLALRATQCLWHPPTSQLP